MRVWARSMLQIKRNGCQLQRSTWLQSLCMRIHCMCWCEYTLYDLQHVYTHYRWDKTVRGIQNPLCAHVLDVRDVHWTSDCACDCDKRMHGGQRLGCSLERAVGWWHWRSERSHMIAVTRGHFGFPPPRRVAEIQTHCASLWICRSRWWENPKAQQVAVIYQPELPHAFTR